MSEFVITNRLIFLVFGLICLDVITGIVKATKHHSIKSALMTKGSYKKFLILLVVCLAWGMDVVFFQTDTLYTAVCTFYILNESLSIIENLGKCGVPIPTKLKSVLEELKDKE